MKSFAPLRWFLRFGLMLWCLIGVAESNETFVVKFAPYLNGKPWIQFPITAYVERSSNLWVHPLASTNFPTLQEVQEKDCDFATVILRLPNGQKFKTYNSLGLRPYLSEVHSGDFNADGKPDFMAVKPSTGNGIAGEFCTGLFAFSDGDQYRFTRITTMSLGVEKLVAAPISKEFRLVHTSLRSGKGSDGKVHSFWVHRFFAWNGGAFQLDPKLEPVWIQCLERPNHDPTKLLTSQLKKTIFTSEAEGGFEW